MTKLDEIRARWAAATPGPWVEDDGNVLSRPLGDARRAAIVAKLSGEQYDVDAIEMDPFVATTEQRARSEADAAAIAAAPEDIAWLLTALVGAADALAKAVRLRRSATGLLVDPKCGCTDCELCRALDAYDKARGAT